MNSPFSLEGKIILVTGASSGIGQTIALTLSQAGAEVVITGRSIDRLTATYECLSKNKKHSMKTAELNNEEEIDNLSESLPILDGVVFCAGAIEYMPAKQITAESMDSLMNINFKSQILLYKALHNKRKLAKKSSLVFISSISSQTATPATLVYAASKAAIVSSVRVLASELSKLKIRVNSISPGLVKTPLLDNSIVEQEKFAENEARYPLGFCEAEDIANASIFLLSDASKKITGTDIVVDGGYLLKR